MHVASPNFSPGFPAPHTPARRDYDSREDLSDSEESLRKVNRGDALPSDSVLRAKRPLRRSFMDEDSGEAYGIADEVLAPDEAQLVREMEELEDVLGEIARKRKLQMRWFAATLAALIDQ